MNQPFVALSSLLFLCGSIAASFLHSYDGSRETISLQKKFDAVDFWMNKAINTLRIPGIAVGIVVDGEIVFTKGYGVRDVSKTLPVTKETLFAIGSCTKAFTTFALGQLVDKGMLAWDDTVIKHIPEFRLKDIHTTHHLTLRDLLAHRTGFPRHDLVWYGATFPRSEILSRLQYLEPVNELREKFQYNNGMYALAGLVIEKVTGQTWEEYVQKRIFGPLEMEHSNFSVDVSQMSADFALPHSEKGEQVRAIPFRDISIIGPAGSINASVANMAKWVQLQLSEGKYEGQQLINKETLKEMHVVHMPLQFPFFEEPSIFGYGLGWMTGLYKGHYTVMHGGGIDGFASAVILFPKEEIGVVILTNSDCHGLFPACAAYGIANHFLGEEEGEWFARIEVLEKQMKESQKNGDTIEDAVTIRPMDHYLGEFEHPGYGLMRIAYEKEGLIALHNEMSYLLQHKGYDHFIAASQTHSEYKVDCFFASNSSGEISELHIALEPSLPSIVFKRIAEREFLTFDYLKKFTGTFKSPTLSVDISFKKDYLIATVPGQAVYKMKPEKNNLFSLKEVPSFFLQFILDAEGAITELQLKQSGQTLHLKPEGVDVLKD